MKIVRYLFNSLIASIIIYIFIISCFYMFPYIKAVFLLFGIPFKDCISKSTTNPKHLQKLLTTKKCPGCYLGNVNLYGTDLVEANLKKAKLVNAFLDRANLTGANLSNAEFSWNEWDDGWGGRNKCNVDFVASLNNVKLNRSNLTKANLQYVSLKGAHLIQANLRGANLRYSDLRGANLAQADLSDSKIGGADLRGANLLGAKLFDYQKSYVESHFEPPKLEGAIMPDGKIYQGNSQK